MVYSTFLHVLTLIPCVEGSKDIPEGEISSPKKKSFLQVCQFPRTMFSKGDAQRKKQG